MMSMVNESFEPDDCPVSDPCLACDGEAWECSICPYFSPYGGGRAA